MTLETRIVALAQAIGTDIKALKTADGTLSSLNTTAKSNLVAALNELFGMIGSTNTALGALISDTATNGATTVTWSADKIFDEIALAKTAVTNALVNGASTALDTLNELATALGNDPAFATTLATEIGNRVRFDAAQTLDATQKAQARTNIGAAAASDLSDLVTAVGDTTRDLSADYATAKV
jgi:hypothetical protein